MMNRECSVSELLGLGRPSKPPKPLIAWPLRLDMRWKEPF